MSRAMDWWTYWLYETHPQENTASIKFKVTISKSSIWKRLPKFRSLFNFKMVVEQNIFIFEHDYAEDVCNS